MSVPPFRTPRARSAAMRDLAERQPLLARQRRRPRDGRSTRRAALLGLGLTLATASAGALAWWGSQWLRSTPLLAVRSIEVLGHERLVEAALVEAAAIPPGTNLLALDPIAVRERLEALPGVRHARVVRQFPGRVALLVQEREPYVLANADGLFWLDAEGRVLGPEPHPLPPHLPILTGVTLPAEPAASAPDRVQTGLALLRILSRVGGRLVPRVSEIDLGRSEGPVLYTTEGVEVRIGVEAWEERLARLDALLAGLEERGERVASIDLRFRDLVVMTPGDAHLPPERHRARPGGRVPAGITTRDVSQ